MSAFNTPVSQLFMYKFVKAFQKLEEVIVTPYANGIPQIVTKHSTPFLTVQHLTNS